MPWTEETKKENYWIPEVEPEKTDEWQTTQMSKSYLKPDGSITGHPGWYFGNGAYASDEYFYHNYGWYTIIEGDQLDSENGKYVIVESSQTEWEKFDTYKIRKSYKKYLHNKLDKPAFEFGQTVEHSYVYDEEKMIVSDSYSFSNLTGEKLESAKNEFLRQLRNVRNFILKETDYITTISVEGNLELSQEFIDYRQALRDLPQQFDFDTLTEDDYNKILSFGNRISFLNQLGEDVLLSVNDINISCFPQKPTNFFLIKK